MFPNVLKEVNKSQRKTPVLAYTTNKLPRTHCNEMHKKKQKYILIMTMCCNGIQDKLVHKVW